MPIVRSNSDFQLIDYTDEINLIPRANTLLTDMGLFETKYTGSEVIQIERVNEITTLFDDRKRGGERNFIGSENAQTENFSIPFFPLDRHLNASDLQNFRAYGTGNGPKTLESEIIRVMARLRRSHSELIERIMMEAIMGSSYSPSGLASYDYYSVWGQTQQTADIDFTNGEDAMAIIESDVRRHIIDNANDGASSYKIFAICGSDWFDALISSSDIEEAYKYYSSSQELLRERQGGDLINRRFVHKGITFIEDISGYIDASDAYFMPKGIEGQFQLYYGPGDDIMNVNQSARELTLLFQHDPFNRKARLISETAPLAVVTRPELIVKSTAS
jgi:hypothetical protein